MFNTLSRLRASPRLQQEFAEQLITDIMNQLEPLDPRDESEEFLNQIECVCGTEEGKNFLAYLLGTDTLEEYFEEYIDLEDFDDDEDEDEEDDDEF